MPPVKNKTKFTITTSMPRLQPRTFRQRAVRCPLAALHAGHGKGREKGGIRLRRKFSPHSKRLIGNPLWRKREGRGERRGESREQRRRGGGGSLTRGMKREWETETMEPSFLPSFLPPPPTTTTTTASPHHSPPTKCQTEPAILACALSSRHSSYLRRTRTGLPHLPL